MADGPNIGFATLSVIPSLKGMDATIRGQLGGFGPLGQSAGRLLGDGISGGATAGTKSLKSKLLPLIGVAGAVGTALFKIGSDFDDASDTIRVGTGETGRALGRLEGDFRKVVSTVPADFGSAATAVTDLHRRLDITGRPLRRLSAQFLELSRITKTDVGQNVADVTRVFGDWAIEMRDQPKALDAIFRASQATGVGVGRLSQGVVKFGAPLRQLGFGFAQSLGLMGKFEKEGVNTELVMGSLRIALGKLARSSADVQKAQLAVTVAEAARNKALREHGAASVEARAAEQSLAEARATAAAALKAQDVPAAFRAQVDAIKDAGSAAKANALALQLFGARAGPDMAAAIREGRFNIGKLFDTIASGKDTVRKAGKDTRDLAEEWLLFKNRLKTAIEPLARGVFDALGKAMKFINTPAGRMIATFVGIAGAAIGLAFGIKQVGEAFTAIKALATTNPFALALAGAIVAAVLIIKNWDKVKGFFLAIGRFFSRIGAAIGRFFSGLAAKVIPFAKKFWPLLIAVLFPLAGVAIALVKFRGPIIDFFKKLPGWILKALGAVGSFLLNAGKALLEGLWNGAKAILGAYLRFYVQLPRLVLRALGNVARWLFDAGKAVLRGLWSGAKVVIPAMLRFWASIPVRVLRALGNLVKFLFDKGKELLGGLWDGAQAIFGSLFDWVKGLPGRILRGIGNLGTLLIEVGKDIIRGLWEGIKAMGPWLLGKLTGFFKSFVPGPIKHIFGIDSPSKLFKGYGRNIVEGFALGIVGSQRTVTRAMDQLSRAVTTPDIELEPISVTRARHQAARFSARPAPAFGTEGASADPGRLRVIEGRLTLDRDGHAFIRGIVVDEITDAREHSRALNRMRRR
jgi:phage-related protein